MRAAVYRLQFVHRRRGESYARIVIPSEITTALTAKGINTFHVELADEGILLRPVIRQDEGKLPKWLAEAQR